MPSTRGISRPTIPSDEDVRRYRQERFERYQAGSYASARRRRQTAQRVSFVPTWTSMYGDTPTPPPPPVGVFTTTPSPPPPAPRYLTRKEILLEFLRVKNTNGGVLQSWVDDYLATMPSITRLAIADIFILRGGLDRYTHDSLLDIHQKWKALFDNLNLKDIQND